MMEKVEMTFGGGGGETKEECKGMMMWKEGKE